MTIDFLLSSEFLGGVGILALFTAFFLWRRQRPEKYKRAKKRVLRFLNTTEQLGYALGFMASLSALGCVAVYFYSEKTVLAIQTSSPEVYAFISGYILAVQVAGLMFFSLFFLLKMVLHHHNSLDNGIIDDPDVERRFLRTDLLMNQMEKNRREEMAQMKTAMDKFAEVVVATQQNYYEQGKRFAENPTPPIGTQERRVIVRNDPSIPVTKEEVLATLLPETILEEIVQEGAVHSSDVEPTKKEIIPIPELFEPAKEEINPPRKLSWLRASDWDEKIFGKLGKL